MTRDKKSGKAAFNDSNSHAHTRTLILARSCANAAAAAVRLGARRAYCLARERERRLELRRALRRDRQRRLERRRALPRDRQLCRERRLECRRALPRRHARAPRQRSRALRPPRAAISNARAAISNASSCDLERLELRAQRVSEAIRGNQWHSEAISGNQRHSEAIDETHLRVSSAWLACCARSAVSTAHPASLLLCPLERASPRKLRGRPCQIAVSSTASTSRWLSPSPQTPPAFRPRARPPPQPPCSPAASPRRSPAWRRARAPRSSTSSCEHRYRRGHLAHLEPSVRVTEHRRRTA